MRNNKEKSRFPASSQHGSQQDPNAGNQFEEQLDRFKEIFGIAAGRGSDTELGGKIRLTQQAIGKWREKGSIPSKWITKICDDQKINMNWLRDGEGPMRLDELCVREERGEYKVFTKPPRCGGLLPDHFVLVRCADAPLGAGAKSPIPNESPYQLLAFRNDWISKVASAWENLILFPVKGPSMEPTMFDGDLVMIDTGQKGVIRDLIYAVRIEETLTVKRVQKLPDGRYRLVSDNKNFPPEDFAPEEVHVAGHVIWLARDHIK